MRDLKILALAAVVWSAVVAQGMPWPIQVTGGIQYMSSGYGLRARPMGGGGEFHYGIDIACREGTPIIAVGNGEVIVCAAGDPVFGRYMIVHLDSGIDVLYGHLRETWYARGSRVKEGQVIGLTGNTGKSTGPHLHFAIMVDPMLALGMGNPDPRKW